MIVFDLETTGLPKAEGSDLDIQPKIIEFGGIKLDEDLNELGRLEFFCNPGHPLDKILKFELERNDKLTKFPWPIEHICTVEIGKSVWGTYRKLADIYFEVTGEEHKGAHRSIADVLATVEILKWYKKEGHI